MWVSYFSFKLCLYLSSLFCPNKKPSSQSPKCPYLCLISLFVYFYCVFICVFLLCLYLCLSIVSVFVSFLICVFIYLETVTHFFPTALSLSLSLSLSLTHLFHFRAAFETEFLLKAQSTYIPYLLFHFLSLSLFLYSTCIIP